LIKSNRYTSIMKNERAEEDAYMSGTEHLQTPLPWHCTSRTKQSRVFLHTPKEVKNKTNPTHYLFTRNLNEERQVVLTPSDHISPRVQTGRSRPAQCGSKHGKSGLSRDGSTLSKVEGEKIYLGVPGRASGVQQETACWRQMAAPHAVAGAASLRVGVCHCRGDALYTAQIPRRGQGRGDKPEGWSRRRRPRGGRGGEAWLVFCYRCLGNGGAYSSPNPPEITGVVGWGKVGVSAAGAPGRGFSRGTEKWSR
jgi:hypothetical protein